MILLFLLGVTIGLIYMSYILVIGLLGLGAKKLAPKRKNSVEYLDEQIGKDKRTELLEELVEKDCNCSFEYDIKRKYFDIDVVNKKNEEKTYDILIKHGVKNFRIV